MRTCWKPRARKPLPPRHTPWHLMSIDSYAPAIAPRIPNAPGRSASSSNASVTIARAETPVRQVALLVDPSCLRRVHSELARQLSECGIRTTAIRSRSHHPLPWSARLLLELERVTRRIAGTRLTDEIDFAQLMLTDVCPTDPPDLVIDLCEDRATRPDGRTVRILYDGAPGETALMGALLAGRMPAIDIEEVETGAILACGIPCADNAGTILEAFECVLARVVTLLLSVMRNPAPLVSAQRSAHSLRTRSLVAFEAKAVARSIVRRLYALCCYTPHWRTCWRFVDGPDLWQTGTLAGTAWNVIPDPGFRFYADPFPFVHQGRSYVFLEDWDHRRNKAVISVVPFGEGGPSGPARPVLEEPWHLSYPFLIAHDGQIWMIPESSASRSLTLYRADPFPDRWVAEARLLSDIEASDATVIRHKDCFWMFAATRDGHGSWSDTLSIFHARDLHGPWQAHRRNPILVDQAAARPAGAVVARDGKLWRPVQDCTDGYGTGIGLAEIVRLDHEGFEQRTHCVLRPQPNWPGRRLHTLNRAGRLECIDGAAYSPRSRVLARRLQSWSGRRELPRDWGQPDRMPSDPEI
jgi:hypothetical protein